MTPYRLTWANWSLDLSARTHIMGIVNVTPDSFSDGGDFYSTEAAVAQGRLLAEAGADILDVGGESTRPGSSAADHEEELGRVIPVIEALAAEIKIPISIDTTKSAVAEAALESGASIVNDISAGRFDPEIVKVAARAKTPLILMHMKGRPRTMQNHPVYEDLMGEITGFLLTAAGRAEAAGVSRDLIVLDPGIGFGKTFDHNLVILNRLEDMTKLGYPLLVGHSRKAFLGHLLDGAQPKEREVATNAVTALAAYKGVHIIRTHDVAQARQTLAVVNAIMREHA